MLKKYFGITLLGAMIALSGCETMPTQTSASQISAINQANLVRTYMDCYAIGQQHVKNRSKPPKLAIFKL